MSNQLIPVFTGEINKTEQNLCNARDLHSFLGLKSQFANWIGNRIKQYQFIDSVDFFSFNKIIKRAKGGSPARKEYHLTLDMAKELAMVERNEQGRQARRYFIDCERLVLEGIQNNLIDSQPKLTVDTLAIENTELIDQQEALETEIAALQQRIAEKDELLTLYRYKTETQGLQLKAPDKPKRKSPTPITANEINAINSLHQQGESTSAIAKKIGRSTASVHYILRGAKAGGES